MNLLRHYLVIAFTAFALSITACGKSDNNEARKMQSSTKSEYDKCMSEMVDKGSRAGLSFSDNYDTARMVCDKFF